MPKDRPSASANCLAPDIPIMPFTESESSAALDRVIHAAMGRLTSGISPIALTLAYMDWALHFAVAPGKWTQLAEKAHRKGARFRQYAACALTQPHAQPCIEPLPQDRRFASPAWHNWPFNFIHQQFLLQQQWWHNMTTGLGGVSPHHEQVVSFVARQLLDMVSPVNFVATNPDVLRATAAQGGMNFWRGAQNFAEDCERLASGKMPKGTEQFVVGRDVAVTPGDVVYRNRLFELIRYAPATKEVYAEPILIVPAWIMKFYILDLSPGNSLVKYMVERGHTVFMISWHNPNEEDRDLGMDDYLRRGLLEALDVVAEFIPGAKINTVGYCLGGTLLAIAAAYLARRGDGRLNTITLLTAQTDFTEAGELTLFIDDSQLSYMEDIMWSQGYLDTRQMAGAFQILRSNDLIWSRVVNEYLLGRRDPMSDLMAWNSDTTRMPYRMHSEYLRRLFLKNELFEGRYKVDGRPVAMGDIVVPMFVVATEADHVAPWKSVYKIHLLADADINFVLASGGHNAGIVSEPEHEHRHFRIASRMPGEKYTDPERWMAATPVREGSWWPSWVEWLNKSNSGRIPISDVNEKAHVSLEPAPGRYVLER